MYFKFFFLVLVLTIQSCSEITDSTENESRTIIYREKINIYPTHASLFSISTNGSNKIQLTPDSLNVYPNHQGAFDLASDGSLLAFIADNTKLYIMDINGNNLRKIETPTLGLYNPVFSPDNLKIVFLSTYAHNQYDEKTILYIVDIDGSNLLSLYSCNNSHELLTPNFINEGDKVLFSYRGDNISTININGTGLIKFPEFGIRAKYSPDGSKIAFIKSGYYPSPDDIFIMNSDGSDKKNITNQSDSTGGIHDLWFHPNGDKILYAQIIWVDGKAAFKFYVINIDGSEKKLISSSFPLDYYGTLSISSDGEQIISSEGAELLIINFDGSGLSIVPNTFYSSYPLFYP